MRHLSLILLTAALIPWSISTAAMAADPVTQDWWKVCMPMQSPLQSKKDSEWWAGMEEVFHLD